MMMSERKPAAGLWITFAILSALVLYVLSFGPVCWLNSRTEKGETALAFIYRPVGWVMKANQPAANILSWYACLAAPYARAEVRWNPKSGFEWWDWN